MTPKEKAEELVNEMFDYTEATYQAAKKCALIAVDEIINNNNKIPGNAVGLHIDANINYWKEVKQEIEKL